MKIYVFFQYMQIVYLLFSDIDKMLCACEGYWEEEYKNHNLKPIGLKPLCIFATIYIYAYISVISICPINILS